MIGPHSIVALCAEIIEPKSTSSNYNIQIKWCEPFDLNYKHPNLRFNVDHNNHKI